MDNNSYSIYLESVFDLANTLKIKLQYNIDSINNYLALAAPTSFNVNDPHTWKYYLNVSGTYHSTDTVMNVVSLDTLEEIVFNKDNLLDHRATALAYQYGSRYYKELVSKYPNQETLIQGILYPVDIERAISAKEGEIFGYPDFLIEANEYSLIAKLNQWVKGFTDRWVNAHFAIAHDLYYTTMYAILYSLLPQSILKFREEACFTVEAHSFHVKQFLASNGKLDRFYPQMTLKQSLWLYRNLLYVKKNLGFSHTFSHLTKNIMTERKIPVSQYTGFHDVQKMPGELYPDVYFRKEQVNEVLAVETANPLPLNTMLEKEDTLAKNNYDVRVNDSAKLEEKLENAPSNKVLTKTLETTLFDYTGSSIYNLNDILLHHWIYFSFLGLYEAYVQVENPRTGEVINLRAKDAFLLGLYLYCYAFKVELTTLPSMVASRVQRIPLATKADLNSIVDTHYLEPDLAYKMLAHQPVIEPMISTERFYETCYDIYISANYQKNLYSLEEHYYGRALAQAMANRIYCDYVCNFAPNGETYSDWFTAQGIPIEDFLVNSPYTEWTKILQKATGLDLNTTNSVAAIQKAMTNIMVNLSSYSVQYVNNTNTNPIEVFENPPVRVGDFISHYKGEFVVDPFVVDVLTEKAKFKQAVKVELANCAFEEVVSTLMHANVPFEITVSALNDEHPARQTFRVDTSRVGSCIEMLPTLNTRGIIDVPGLDIFLAQSLADQQKVADLYDPTYLDQTNHR